MIRRPPIKTYQKKKSAQTSFSCSQPSFWEPRTYSTKIITKGKKNKPSPTQDHKDDEDISSDYFDTTFDKVAKTARLPLLPQQQSHTSLNFSSDVPEPEPSPFKIDATEFLLETRSPKVKANKRPKRKAAQTRVVYEDTDAIVKKRLKQDLMNLSTKKVKAVRNAKRKVTAKTGVNNVKDSKNKLEQHVQGLILNNANDVKKQRKQNQGYLLRRRAQIQRILNSSSSDDDCSSNQNADISNMKSKSKKSIVSKYDSVEVTNPFHSLNMLINGQSSFSNTEIKDKECLVEKFENTSKIESSLVNSSRSVNTSRLSTISNRTRSKIAMKNSPALDYVENFRRYSALKSRENDEPVGFRKYRRILPAAQSILDDTEPANTDDLKTSEMCKNLETNQQDLPIKPCSVLLLKCNEDKDQILRKMGSETVAENMHSTEDMFQSSISYTTSNTTRESRDAEPSSVSITEHDAQPSVPRKAHFDTNKSLYYLKCSTPINVHGKIDQSMNRLSPITCGNETAPRVGRIVDETEVIEPSVENYAKQYLEGPKTRTRRKSIRKKLSISYEEDESLVMSDEYCKENEVVKIVVDNATTRNSQSRKMKNMQSPTSEIQESLEVLKLNLGNSINKYNVDNNDKRQSSLKEIETVSTGSKEFSTVFESMNTCSQLTPTGILTTRSGRQLKLSNSMQQKFFNDSESKIKTNDPVTSIISDDRDSESDYDIVEDSEIEKKAIITSKINKKRGSQFSVHKSHSIHESRDYGNDSVIDTSKTQAPNDSSFHELMGGCSSRILQTMSVNDSSKLSTQETEISSVLDDNRSDLRVSDTPNPRNVHTTLSTEEMLASMMESIKTLGSLDITSHVDVNEESWQSSASKDDNTDCKTDVNTCVGKQDSKTELKSACPTNTVDSHANSDLEWSTLSSNNQNVDSTTSKREDSSMNSSLKSYENSMTSYGKEVEDSLSNKASTRSQKICIPSPDTSDVVLERSKLLSCRITTRKRRKTFMKPLEVDVLKNVEEQVEIHISDHSNLNNSVHSCSETASGLQEYIKTEDSMESFDQPTNPDLFRHPLHINLDRNLQPLVLIKKLEDPLKITAKDKQAYDLGLTAINEISHESSESIFLDIEKPDISSGEKIVENNEEFEKSDPLYLPPRRSKRTDQKNTKTSSKSTNRRVSKLNVSGSAKAERKSTLISVKDAVLEKPKRSSSSKANKSSPSESKRQVSKLNVSESEVMKRQSLFLKPGKDWTRSLSILNNIQNGSDLEQLSTGKGKNWRMSVQAILDMQQQQQERVVQSCLGKNEDDKDPQPRFKALNCTSVPDTAPCSEEPSIGSASPGRFIRRMSIRVVPDKKRLTHIEDTSFLEAYGITPSKSRKSFTRRSEIEPSTETPIDHVPCKDVAIETLETEPVVTARDVVLQRCSQDDYLPFIECFPAEYLEHCIKIGEGVYGEVFLYAHEEDKSVIKIIPIEGSALVNGERQKRFDEILSEIVIARELHDLRYGENNQTLGFVEVKNIRCINGEYPDKLIELWKAYDNDKGSDNDCPSMFDKNQLYIVLELGHGGQDLEAFVFNSAVEAHALFAQAAFALAVAEQSLEFEHRDLHWGNVLISETKDKEVAYKLNNKEYLYPTRGLQVSIIDFTLSRMSYDGCCIFNDLALDPALFTAQGEYQFEVYRLMKEKTGNDWQRFEPYTNLLWLHYTIDKMMTALRYKRKYAKGHREALFWFHELKDEILNYKSAFDFVTNCEKIRNLQCRRTMETTKKSNKTE